MSFVQHKEKERLRHHKQLHLFNQILEHVPNYPSERQTKVRKLRRLVLYVQYLKAIEKLVTGKDSDFDNELVISSEDSVNLPSKSEIPKVPSRSRKKRSKAHIVFLHSAKPKSNSSVKKFQKDLTSNSETNSHKLQDSSADLAVYEYTVPDRILSNMSNQSAEAKNIYVPDSEFKAGNITCPTSKSKLSEIPVCEKERCSILGKENMLITSTDKQKYFRNNYNEDEAFVKNVIVAENLSSSEPISDNCKNVLDMNESYILKDITFSATGKDNIGIYELPQVNEFASNHSESYPVAYTSSMSDMFDSSKVMHQSSIIPGNSIYCSNVYPHSYREPVYGTHAATSGFISDSSNSSTLTDFTNKDLDNMSDYKSPSQHSEFNDNSCHSGEIFNHNAVTSDESVESSERPNFSFYPKYNYENDYFINPDISMLSVNNLAHPFMDGTYPIGANLSCVYPKSVIVTTEPVPSLSDMIIDNTVAFGNNDYIFYQPVNNFQSSPTKSVSSEYNLPSEGFTDVKQELCLEDEESYPLAEYFSKCYQKSI